jgi:tetratricopeptide (TPR) repeat protein
VTTFIPERFSGSDPALELALHGDKRTIEDVAADLGAQAAFIFYQQQKEKYSGLDWWIGFQTETLESSLNYKGYQLIQNQDLDGAFEVFTLNSMLFPDSFNVWDSLGECCFNMKKYDLSLKHYRKSVEIDPTNENGNRMIARILEEMGR